MEINEKRDKYLELTRELKKTMETESDGDSNCKWCAWHSHQRIGIGTRGVENKKMSENHPNYRIIKIDQNTEKSPGDSRRLPVVRNR